MERYWKIARDSFLEYGSYLINETVYDRDIYRATQMREFKFRVGNNWF
jgi:hypothetical protein